MATYYVRSAGGNDGNDGLSFANGWATVQYAADNAGSDDLVLICADGNHTPAATVDFDTNAGSTATPTIFRGANATGGDDGTVATISGSSLGAGDDLIDLNIASLNIKFENLRFTAATQYNINCNTAINNGYIAFNNCRIDSATSHGMYQQESTANFGVFFTDCEIDGNGGDGIASAGISRGGYHMVNCNIHDNTGDGVEDTCATYPKSIYIGCNFYDNGGHGLSFVQDTYGILIMNCVFFGNTSNGIEFTDANSFRIKITNSIFRSNGGYGIDCNGKNIKMFDYCDYNCSHNNTSGHIDINGGTLPGSNNVTSDPTFTSETDGSEDFTLQSGSPCLNVGLGYDG